MSRTAAEAQLSPDEQQRYQQRLRAALTTIVAAVARCDDSPEAQAAYAGFDVLIVP